MAEVKWIKISTDIFSNRKIRQIGKLPEGDSALLIWIKLLCLAGTVNDGGAIYLTPEIPYTEETLATELEMPPNTVRLALGAFQRFGMIEIEDDGTIRLPSWEKHQNVEGLEKIREQNRRRNIKYRERKRLADAAVTSRDDTEEIKEKDKDKEKEKEDPFCLADPQNREEDVWRYGEQRDEARQTYMSGSLGRGVVFISEEQMDDLLEKLSVEEFDHYVSVVADCELKGKHFAKTHYQAILDMAAKDRKIVKR